MTTACVEVGRSVRGSTAGAAARPGRGIAPWAGGAPRWAAAGGGAEGARRALPGGAAGRRRRGVAGGGGGRRRRRVPAAAAAGAGAARRAPRRRLRGRWGVAACGRRGGRLGGLRLLGAAALRLGCCLGGLSAYSSAPRGRRGGAAGATAAGGLDVRPLADDEARAATGATGAGFGFFSPMIFSKAAAA